jgi:hypothetical protein
MSSTIDEVIPPHRDMVATPYKVPEWQCETVEEFDAYA